MIPIADNFQYRGGKSLDSRLLYDTVALMKAVPDADLYDGCLAYVKATKKYYTFNSTNTVDTTLGKWREFSGGGSGSGSVVDGYYKEADGKFYEESTYTTEITGAAETLYIDRGKNDQYIWDGTKFVLDNTRSKDIAKNDFDALPAADKNNGTTYYIPDATMTSSMMVVGNRFDKANIYTTTEKMIGSWMGKPLYQKTIDCGNGPVANATKNVNPNISNVDKIVSIKGVAIDENSNALDANNVWINWSTYDVDGYTMTFTSNYSAAGGSTHDVAIRSKSKDLSDLYFYVTIQYTKTTDGTISIGTPNDYSTDEMIIGTWLDGKKLYQKTVWTTAANGVIYTDTEDIQIVQYDGYLINGTSAHADRCPIKGYWYTGNVEALYSYVNGGKSIYLVMVGNTLVGQRVYITIQYTKDAD